MSISILCQFCDTRDENKVGWGAPAWNFDRRERATDWIFAPGEILFYHILETKKQTEIKVLLGNTFFTFGDRNQNNQNCMNAL